MKILIVEDEQELRETIRTSLLKEKFVVETAADYFSALDKINDYDYDCVLLDIMLPGGSGLDLLRELKRLHRTDSVLIISAKDSLDDKVDGLELGADDYVPKPCPPRELAARLNAILRRTANMPSAIAPVVAGPLTINPSRREATANGIVIDLTGTELTLLEVLARKVGTPVPKDEIYQKVLGRAMQRYDRAIDVHVSSSRHKLAAVLGTSVAIESIRGVGYQFVVR